MPLYYPIIHILLYHVSFYRRRQESRKCTVFMLRHNILMIKEKKRKSTSKLCFMLIQSELQLLHWNYFYSLFVAEYFIMIFIKIYEKKGKSPSIFLKVWLIYPVFTFSITFFKVWINRWPTVYWYNQKYIEQKIQFEKNRLFVIIFWD